MWHLFQVSMTLCAAFSSIASGDFTQGGCHEPSLLILSVLLLSHHPCFALTSDLDSFTTYDEHACDLCRSSFSSIPDIPYLGCSDVEANTSLLPHVTEISVDPYYYSYQVKLLFA